MRCYNGAPDSEMQTMLDRQAALMKRIRGAEPGAHCTYFPVEGTCGAGQSAECTGAESQRCWMQQGV